MGTEQAWQILSRRNQQDYFASRSRNYAQKVSWTRSAPRSSRVGRTDESRAFMDRKKVMRRDLAFPHNVFGLARTLEEGEEVRAVVAAVVFFLSFSAVFDTFFCFEATYERHEHDYRPVPVGPGDDAGGW